MKNIRFFFCEKIAIFLVVKCSVYLNRRVFVMTSHIFMFFFSTLSMICIAAYIDFHSLKLIYFVNSVNNKSLS